MRWARRPQGHRGGLCTDRQRARGRTTRRDIRDIAAVDYRGGELILTARNGERIFADNDVDDDDVMHHFYASDAKSFVRELRRRMARER